MVRAGGSAARAAAGLLLAVPVLVGVGWATGRPPAAQGADLDAARAHAEAARPSVGLVSSPLGTGTGWVVLPGVVVTNHHVVGELGAPTTFVLEGGQQVPCRAAGVSPVTDIAALRCEGPLPPPLPLADGDPDVGEPVASVGYPGGQGPVVATGTVVELDERVFGWGRLGTSARAEPGSSSSPVLDARGEVVSIVTFQEVGTDRSYGSRMGELRFLLIDLGVIDEPAWERWVALIAERAWIPVVVVVVLGLLSGWRAPQGRPLLRAAVLGTVAVVAVAGYCVVEYVVQGPARLYS